MGKTNYDNLPNPILITTACSLATVATWTTQQVSALIVCGGKDQKSKTVAEVEVFHSATFQWHAAASLPFPRHNMKPVTIQNTLYLAGGETASPKCSIFSISISSRFAWILFAANGAINLLENTFWYSKCQLLPCYSKWLSSGSGTTQCDYTYLLPLCLLMG